MATPTKSETEDLKEQLETLKTDVSELVSMMSTTAVNTANRTAEDLSAQIVRVKEEIREKAESGYTSAENHVVSNPMQSLLIAAGVGFLFGAITRR